MGMRSALFSRSDAPFNCLVFGRRKPVERADAF
jgi:hypothetical protein